MRKDNVTDPRLKEWLTRDGPTFVGIKELVSKSLRDKFRFKCFIVGLKEERLELESGIIALLSNQTLGKPSADWLGLYADSEKIRNSGLWNTQHVDSKPLTEEQLDRIKELILRMVRW